MASSELVRTVRIGITAFSLTLALGIGAAALSPAAAPQSMPDEAVEAIFAEHMSGGCHPSVSTNNCPTIESKQLERFFEQILLLQADPD